MNRHLVPCQHTDCRRPARRCRPTRLRVLRGPRSHAVHPVPRGASLVTARARSPDGRSFSGGRWVARGCASAPRCAATKPGPDAAWRTRYRRFSRRQSSTSCVVRTRSPSLASTASNASHPGTIHLVAIPPSLRARWTRGDDVLGRVVDLAVATLRRRGIPVERARWLEPARLVRDQRGLGARSRRLNVEGSLRVRPGIRSSTVRPVGPVVIVDDVLTTGATLREAIRALAEADLAGADLTGRILGAAVIAATRGL